MSMFKAIQIEDHCDYCNQPYAIRENGIQYCNTHFGEFVGWYRTHEEANNIEKCVYCGSPAVYRIKNDCICDSCYDIINANQV